MQRSVLDSTRRPDTADLTAMAETLEQVHTETGVAFIDLVESSPVLLVFLRYAGCTFCREALSDIAVARDEIEAGGARIVLVHMGDRAQIKKVIARYGLADVERICDPDRRLYRMFGLKRGSWFQLFGP